MVVEVRPQADGLSNKSTGFRTARVNGRLAPPSYELHDPQGTYTITENSFPWRDL